MSRADNAPVNQLGEGQESGVDPIRPVAVLIGPPGAGKSTVGALLAGLLGVELRDTDAAIEEAQGTSISDIFVTQGEPAFRALERAEVLFSLANHPGVLALGGGAVMQEEVTHALSQGEHRVIFLDVTIADASSRVGFDTSRPLLLINPRASWTRLMNQRRPTYEGLASHIIATGGREPDEIAAELREVIVADQEGAP